MALQQACYVENGKAVGGVVPDASSAIGYKENVGGTCANPNGYTAGSFFMASNNGYMYKALTNIARGDAFQIGTNCEQTNVSTELNQLNNNLTELYNPDIEFATTSVISFSNLATVIYNQGVDLNKLTERSKIQIGTRLYHINSVNGLYTHLSASGTTINIRQLILYAGSRGGSKLSIAFQSSTSATFAATEDTDTVQAGVVVKFWY